MPHSAWPGIALVLQALMALLWGLHLVQRRHGLHPELARKALHMAMGAAALSFPWLFSESWPVVLLAAISAAFLAALRLVPSLRHGPGAVIHSVERRSFGDLCFPAGVLAAHVIASGDAFVYAVSVLMLTLADPIAALAGLRCRHPRHWDRGGAKSIQGSAAFFLTASTLALMSMLARTDAAVAQSLLVALTLAIPLTAVEAAGHRGTDNLLIPAAAALLIQWLQGASLPALIVIFLSCLGVALAVAGPRARQLFTTRFAYSRS